MPRVRAARVPAGCPVCGRKHRAWPQRCAYRALKRCWRICEDRYQLDTLRGHHEGTCYLVGLESWLESWGAALPVNPRTAWV